MAVVTKRSTMTFFSDPVCHYSHRVRIVLAEKGVTVDLLQVDMNNPPEDLADLNPYNSLPTLVDRDLALYESKVMMEYLDERFPHPPLLPVYPVARGESRQLIYRIERDWCDKIDMLLEDRGTEKEKAAARKELLDGFLSISPVFTELPFFMNEEFSLVDCCFAPILWRLPQMGITLPDNKLSQPLLAYMESMFTRPAFQESLTEQERELRSAAIAAL